MWRIVVAAALIWYVFQPQKTEVPTVPDDAPAVSWQEKVAPVARILRNADTFDRMVFASVWENAADAVEGSLEEVEVTFENTLGLKVFTESALRVAWGQIADASGKYDGLNAAVERVFDEAFTTDVKPITDKERDDYIDLCRALAWAGMPRG